jgi:hypothetical protein
LSGATELRLVGWKGLTARKKIASKASLRATTRVNRPQYFQALKERKNFLSMLHSAHLLSLVGDSVGLPFDVLRFRRIAGLPVEESKLPQRT